MVPLKGEWTPFSDLDDQLAHHRLWGLIPQKSKQLRPVMVVDGYWGAPEPCKVVGYQGDNWAVIELTDGLHAIYGEYLADMQPNACQKLPHGTCFAEVLARYAVIDIETTGFNRKCDRIIEVAAAIYEYGTQTNVFHTLVNPNMIIPTEITKLTRISQDDVDFAPGLDEVEPVFRQFIGELPLIGHNVSGFDVPFLSAQFSAPINNTIVDTLPMARTAFDLLPRHKLDYLKDVLHLSSAGSHRAMDDVETTNALLWACLSPRKYERFANKAFLDHKTSHGTVNDNSSTKRDTE